MGQSEEQPGSDVIASDVFYISNLTYEQPAPCIKLLTAIATVYCAATKLTVIKYIITEKITKVIAVRCMPCSPYN